MPSHFESIPLPVGDLIETVPGNIFLGNNKENDDQAKITDVELVASYSWSASWTRKIIVPGKPPRWTPLSEARRLPEDSKIYHADRSAAKYPAHPLEPAVVALMKMHPTACHADVVACRDTIDKLMQFLRGNGNSFRMLVEVIHGTIHLIRREKSPKELLPGLGGYGHTFPEAYTTWDQDVKCSASNHRVIKYKFGGLDMFIRFDCKAYINVEIDEVALQQSQENQSHADQMQHLLVNEEHEAPQRTNTTPAGIQVEQSGELIPQSKVTDIKTRSETVKGDVLQKELPRLWISQTPTFILARHDNGIFMDIQVSDITHRIQRWEVEHRQLLGRLASLLRHIRNIAQCQKLNQLEIVRPRNGDIEVHMQTPDSGTAFSEAVKREWSEWLVSGGSKAEEVSAEVVEEPRMAALAAAQS